MDKSRFNGKTGEWLRFLLAASASLVIAYYSAQAVVNDKIADTQRQIAQVNGRVDVAITKEESHFEEVQRSLLRIERFMERIEATGADRATGEPYEVQRRSR